MYADHLPLHRLEGIFAREGIDLARSTLCGWVADVATALAPIGEHLRHEVTATSYLQTDDTGITVLDDRRGSFKARLWVYLDPLGQQVVFDATATHERDGPAAFLAPFRGALQADAYAGYDALYQSGHVVEFGCWAHARRRFVDAFTIDGSAATMVALIQQLYQVERAASGLAAEARQRLRQDQSVPLLARIETERDTLARRAFVHELPWVALVPMDDRIGHSLSQRQVDVVLIALNTCVCSQMPDDPFHDGTDVGDIGREVLFHDDP